MQIKQTVKLLIFGLVLVTGLVATSAFSAGSMVGAACDPATQNCCGGVETSIVTCDETGQGGGIENTGAWGILLLAINILTAGVGVVALGGIVYGAILYISAGGSPEQVKKAMGIFTNVAIGVVAYAAMFALLNFLVPGGLFNSPSGNSGQTQAPAGGSGDGGGGGGGGGV